MKQLRTLLLATLLMSSNYTWATSSVTTIDLADGTTTSGTNWTLTDNLFTITNGANVTVTGTNSSQRRIEVAAGATVTVTLNGVTIQNLSNDQSAFRLYSGANVTLNLTGTNTLKGTSAGIRVPSGASITIDGSGSLTAEGNSEGAGIGGIGASGSNRGETAGNITINGGTITAKGNRGAGIGGGGHYAGAGHSGNGGNGGTFTMNGGNVTASSTFGAGIGGGLGYGADGIDGGSGGTIVINGGTLDASSTNSAGIGGGGGSSTWYNGRGGSGGNITINGGYVKANGNADAAGIGGGMSDNEGSSSAGTITINGGTIELGGSASTIGCTKNAGGTIIINGGSFNGTCNLTPKNYANTTVVKVPMIIGNPPNANALVTAGAINGTACYPWTYTKETGGLGGYGICDVKADADGKVYFWLPESTAEKIILEANSTQYSATFARSNEMAEQTLAQNSETLTTQKRIPEVSDFTFTPPPSVTYDGNPHPATVTCSKTGMGTFQILYNNSSNEPVAAEYYEVYINVAEGTEYIARNFLIGSFVIDWRSINSADVTVTITGSRVYTGAQLRPDFTVNDTGAPITTSDYETIDWIWGTNINPGTNAGSVYIYAKGNYTGSRGVYFNIEKATPTAALLTFTPTEVLFDESPHAVNVAWADGVAGHGSVTATYYNGNTNAPSELGNYNISVDIDAGDNYTDATGLTLNGTFSIKTNEEETTPTPPTPTPPTPTPPTPPTPDTYLLNYTIPSDLIYDGNTHPVKVEQKSWVTGLGFPINVNYNGYINNIPQTAGTYRVSVDIPQGTYYNTVTNLTLGNFQIFKKIPTTADFIYNLTNKIVYNGNTLPLKVTTLDTINGMGTFNVLYDGYNKAPSDTGTYQIVLNIDEGLNYTAADILLGNYIITTTQQTVQFDTITNDAYINLDPNIIHYHDKGEDFIFILTTGVLNYGRKPVVATAEPLQNLNSWIEIKINTDSTYIVTIHELTENINVNINFTQTDGSTTNNNTEQVWSTGKQLFLRSTRNATAYIYSIAGTLIQTASLQTNTLAKITLPTGFYVVALNGKIHKVVIR